MTTAVDLVLSPFDAAPRDVVDAARRAEDIGFDGIWTYDHLSGRELGSSHVAEAWTLLGAMAHATSRISLGPLVANATIRHPAVIANAAATLQELSGGRALLGLGAGSGPESRFGAEYDMIGLARQDAATRREMVVEAIEVIGRLWSGGGDVAGRHFALRGAELFIRPSVAPPIIVGVNGPKMAELAGRWADGLNIHSWEADPASLVDTARAAARARGAHGFLVTVEAPLDGWLAMAPSEQGRFTGLGLDRLMLVVRPPYPAAVLERAATVLERFRSAGR